jgi:pyridoxamine 5'-phosphate oxidase-like protein
MKRLVKVFASAILIAIVAAAGTVLAATSPRDVSALAKGTYIYIATVRKDGNQSRAVPVWFITTADNQVLIETSPTSWKAKRIKRGSPALVWIGERTGPAFIGKAEIVEDKTLQDQVIAEYPKKYMLARIGFARPTRAKLDSGQTVVIRISPTRDLPQGFQSAPGTPAPPLDEKSKSPSAQ